MELSKSRRVLATILAVIIAAAAGLLIISFSLTSTVTYRGFEEKRLVTDDVISACEAQLDANFAVLAKESGIPERVFAQAKEDFPVADAVHKAFNSQFDSENPSLYSQNMADYFYKLCTEYLDGSGIKYDKSNIRIAADRAARLYSYSVGLQNVEDVAFRIDDIKRTWNKVPAFCAVLILLCAMLLFFLYTGKSKAYAYLTAGIAAGALGAALGATAVLLGAFTEKPDISPAVYAQAYTGLMHAGFAAALVIGLALFAAMYAVLIKLERQIYKKSLK